MKKCLFCAEEILDEAIKCKYCGSMIVDKYGQRNTTKYKSNILNCKQCGGEMKKKIVSNDGAGCLLIITGLILLFFIWPVGLIVLVIGLIVGSKTKNYWVCKECGSQVERQRKWFEF